MWSRKQNTIQSNNLIAEERFLNKKFSLKEEEESLLPEFQVTPEGFGKYKIKYTWKSKGVTIPKDAREAEIFQDPKFDELTKIYANQSDAQIAINDIIRTKSSLFKM
jgi:hypothetical protein